MSVSPVSPASPASTILHRAGLVLLAAGLLDLAFMAWHLAKGAPHSYSMALPAVIGGVLLMRGNLRAAFVLVWIASVLLPMAVASGIMSLLQPLDLTLTQLRLDPAGQLGAAMPLVLFCAVLVWLRHQLLREPVQAAIVLSGRRKPAAHFALGLGVVLGLLALGGQQLGRDADLSRKAEFLARAKHGKDFHYFASSLTPRDDMEGTFVEAKVQAWRADRVDTVDVFWKEK